VTYEFATGYETGYGTLTGGVWTWSGPTVPHQGSPSIHFIARDQLNQPTGDEFVLNTIITNTAPTITCPTMLTVSLGTCKSQNVTIGDADGCDVAGLTVTAVPINPVNGTVTVTVM